MPSLACLVAIAVLLASAAPAPASKAVASRAYVQSGPGGVFYARCVPAAADGTAGRTDVYAVRADGGDDPRDLYDWYAPGGVTLGWSPLAGKVAVLAVVAEERPGGDWRAQEELRFAIGGKVLRSYTSGELIALGAAERVSSVRGRHAGYRVLGCEQVPGTNEYDFVVEVAGGMTGEGTKLRFDITTGALRPDRPRVPIGPGDGAEAVRVARAFMARTHPRLEIGPRPPAATYSADVEGQPMWVVTFDVARPTDKPRRAAGDGPSYAFDVRLRPGGEVESTTSPE